MRRADVKSIAELAEESGLKLQTLYQIRKKNPKSFRLFELQQLHKVLGFTDSEWLQLRGTL